MSKPLINRQILDEAAEWFVDFRVGDVDAAARARFDEWVRRSPEHIQAYWEIARAYVDLPERDDAGKLDVGALIAYANTAGNVVSISARPARAGPARLTRRRYLPAAAVVCGLAGIAVLFWQAQRQPFYSTDVGERRSLTLTDGSTVDLNARSRLRIEFSSTERRVELEAGQALFQVAKDSQRPFVVYSGDARVRVVGTQFDVFRRESGAITVTVIEGRVAVAGTTVSAGEQLTVSHDVIAPAQHADVAVATAWTQHKLIFEGSRLAEVVAEFNRYNRRQLVLADPKLNDFEISGVYSSTDPASLLRFLRDQGVHVTEGEGEIRIE